MKARARTLLAMTVEACHARGYGVSVDPADEGGVAVGVWDERGYSIAHREGPIADALAALIDELDLEANQ